MIDPGPTYMTCSDHDDMVDGGEVRWSTLDGDRCWYCGKPGVPFFGFTITTNLPSQSPATWHRYWRSAA